MKQVQVSKLMVIVRPVSAAVDTTLAVSREIRDCVD